MLSRKRPKQSLPKACGQPENRADNHILRIWLSVGQPDFQPLLRTLIYVMLNKELSSKLIYLTLGVKTLDGVCFPGLRPGSGKNSKRNERSMIVKTSL